MVYQKKNFHTKRVQGGASRQYKKKRPVPRKGNKINWGSVAKTAVDTAATVAKVVSMLNIEKHFLTISASPTNILNGFPYFQLINGLSQGSGAGNRQGQQLKSTNINLRGKLSCNAGASAGASQARIMLVHDRQPNGATFAIVDLLENGQVWSFRTMGYRKRFKVLADKSYQMVLNTANEEHIVDLSAQLDLHTMYNTGNTGTITDIDTGSLYLIVMSDEVSSGPAFEYQLRYRWIDN